MKSLELYFAGAEVPVWRKLLAAEHASHVALNYRQLRQKVSKRWLLTDHFPAEQKIFVDSGAFGINQARPWAHEQYELFVADYLQFIQDNLDRLTYFTECDFISPGLDWVLHHRRETWHGLAPDKFVPVWHREWGSTILRDMIETHPNLGVPTLPVRLQNILGATVRRTRVGLHGLGFSHPHSLSPGLYSTIVSSSWISPTRFGETVVWDRNRLRRYSADEKDKVRRRHRAQFIQAGFDTDKIQADDSTELARYTIWAWRQLEQSLEGPQRMRVLKPKGVTHSAPDRPPEIVPASSSSVTHSDGNGADNGSRLPDIIRPIPVFDFRSVKSTVPSTDGLGTTEMTTSVPVLASSGLRQCDSCSLAPLCPEFSSGSSCKYSIPIEIRNRDQLMAVLSSLLEMQGQRIAFSFFSEQLQGGYPDANLSAELDRFMRMTSAVKDIQDSRDFLKVTVEGRAQAGVLRRLFGAERAETLHRVDPDRAEAAVKRTMQP